MNLVSYQITENFNFSIFTVGDMLFKTKIVSYIFNNKF